MNITSIGILQVASAARRCSKLHMGRFDELVARPAHRKAGGELRTYRNFDAPFRELIRQLHVQWNLHRQRLC